ncbi:amino acid adenylation domain-containing protein [Streptomyces sp. G45]|uniref:non-ribosomal peptide synthetase n=1 Tax=Streptomyces sp. G45 TaxID=3406627 RepID=UPI003C1C0C89
MTAERPRLTPGQAALLAQRLKGGRRATSAGPELAPRPPGAPAEPSFAQMRLWFLDQLQPGAIAYVMPDATYRLRGPVDADALRTALRAVTARHAALRSRFENGDAGPRLVFDDPEETRLDVVDVSTEPDPHAAVRAFVRQAARTPIDLDTGPLLRTTLLRLAPDDHVLQVTVHHSVFDGLSIGVFEADLSTAYRAVLTGTAPDWPELTVDYADFAAWQREALSAEATADDVAYWRERLAGAPPVLELPTDRPRPPVPSYRGGTASFTVPAPVVDALREISRSRRATLFMTTLAAYQEVLGRYARTDDVVVGCPTAGRERPELQDLIGFFVNSLPLRPRLDPGRSFEDLVEAVRDTTLDAFTHQELPFDRIVEELAPPRETGRNPITQTWFDLFTPRVRLELEGTVAEKFPAHWYTTRFDLELHLVEHADGSLRGHLVYAVDLFDRATAERLAEHYVTLLTAVAQDPRRPLGELTMAPPAELDRLLHGWNDTATPERDPDDATVIGAFEQQVTRTPDATALVFGDERLTYWELNSRANQIAWQLKDTGVGPETVVGLLLPRGPELVAALLGVLKAGGAYLPLDPQHPQDRVAFMLDDAGARQVIAAPGLVDRLPAGVAAIEPPAPDGRPRTDPPRATTADHLIYIIYTSGSTGRPKGVAMTHRPLLNLLRWQLGRARTAGPTLQFSAINFDISFQEMFSTWLDGGAIVLVTEDQRRDPDQLLDTMIGAGARRLFCPPMVLEQIAQAASVRPALPPLLDIHTAGEQLHLTREITDLVERLPGARVDNQYGPTEAHVITAHLLEGDPLDWPVDPPVGSPIDNTRVYLLDERMRPVPVGIPGEVYVGGACLARGYLNRPDLTADRFLPDPFATEPGARLYRTGDLARRLDDGTLQFLGRADDQVKIRGYRIEPGEIAALLGEHPDVTDAAVVPIELVRGDLRLAAYVVPAAGTAPDTAALRAYLEGLLPDYMVPSYVLTLPKLPLTGPGKLDRKALPLPDRESGVSDDYAAPRDEREAAMARIWAEATGLERVGVHDDFFDLGGHSLLATRVTARVSKVFGVDLPLRAIFSHRTVARLTAALGGAVPFARTAPTRRPDGEEPQLSFAQRRLWFLDRLQPGLIAYVMPDTTYRIRGPLDVPALEAALRAVLDRHAVLRSHYEQGADGTPRIAYTDSADIAVEHRDLSGEPDPLRAALESTERSGQTPFDLARGPLVRPTVLRLGEDDHVLQVTVHHSVFDGVSIPVFEEELTLAYRARTVPGAPQPAPLPVDYADFAAWQRRALTDEVAGAHAAYWRAKLGGAPPTLELPTDRPRPLQPSFRADIIRFDLPADVVRALRELAGAREATLFMATAAAYQALLGRWAGTDDVVIGCPAAGRDRPELEGLIGLFVNSLPLRTDLSGAPAFGELLDRVRETTLDAFAHQELPFERLVEELAPPRDMGRNPIVQAWFDLFTPHCRLVVEGAEAERIVPEGGTTRFDVELRLAEQEDGGLAGELVYATDLFERATMDVFVEHYAALLARVAKDPGRPVDELVDVAPGERARLLTGFNDSALTGVDPEATVIGRFEEQARATPDATALVAGATRWTYREADERAERMAAALTGRGIGVETRVAVCLPRTAELPLTLLAIAKAGAVAVGLDPDHPAERLRLLAADSGAALVVTAGPDAADGDWPVPVATVADLDAPTNAPPGGRHRAGPRNALYVVYTSGSTGRPKGVVMDHGPTARLMHWAAQRYAPAPVALQYFPVTSDVCAYEMWSTWWTGGTLVLADERDRYDTDRLAALVETHRITTVLLPGAVLGELAARHPERLGSLTEVITTGDRLVITDAIRALGVRVDNQWGSTEVNVVTAGRLSPPAAHWPTLPGIGAPVSEARIYVLDERLRPMPTRVPGDLYVAGPPLARGYLGRPDLTAASFLPDPFAGEPGARMYRTGDRGRWRTDGTLEFLGRADFQLKVHGYRVEPGEIETVLEAHPAVSRAAVTALADGTGGGDGVRLVAHLETPGLDTDALLDWLGDRLPAHMTPRDFVTLPVLPTTATGKIDRGALPAPERSSADGSPRHAVDARIAEVWAEVLGHRDFGVRDDFFALGGHSLLCVEVLHRVARDLGVELPLRVMFTHRTVARLADAVAAAREAEAREAATREATAKTPAVASAGSGEGPRRPSFAQRRLWFLERLQPGLPAYLVPFAHRLRGPLDADALGRAFTGVQDRHEVLRCRFDERDGEPVLLPGPAVPLTVVDLGGAADPLRAAEEHVARDAVAPFDLAGGALVRGTLLRLADDDHVLAVVVHHAVFDGLSRQLFGRELAAAYEGQEVAEPPLRYADFAAWQHDALTADAAAEHLAHWREALAGAPAALELPTARPRPPVPSYRGAVVSFDVDRETAKGLRELARSRGATPFMTALAAFQVLLARTAGVDDVVVGSPVSGRHRPGLDRLIGFFVNLLPLRADLSDDPRFDQLLDRVREDTLAAFVHQDLPFEQLVEELAPPRDLGRNPVVQVCFQLFDADALDAFTPAGLEVSPFDSAGAVTRFDLEMHLTARSDGTLAGELVYATDLFDEAVARRVTEHYATLLAAVVRTPEAPVRSLTMTGPAELDLVARPQERHAAGAGAAVTVAEAFARQARETPDAPALAHGAERWTYARLDARANRVAAALAAHGPEAVVAVLLPRGADLVTALLGTLKAGAAYLPVDPHLPPERIAFLLADSGAATVLTVPELAHLVPKEHSTTLLGAVEAAEDRAAPAPPHPRSGARAAYVVYTSGSTGQPKGVAVPHAALLSLVRWHVATYALRPGDVVSQVASPSFDAAGWEIWPTLLSGACLDVPDDDTVASPQALAEHFAAAGTTLAFAPTPLAEALLDLPLADTTALRALLTGGDVLRPRAAAGAGLPVVNHYGPTENAVVATATGELTAPWELPPIGAPLPHVTAYVLDEALRPVGFGVPGELYLGGAGVARGYVGQPALTASRFVPDPFGGEPGARLYRTGDLALWLEEGGLRFLGRADDQLAIRGYRVEPGEVEAALLTHPGVAAAAVTAADSPGGPQLVGYVVPRGAEPAPAELRAHLAATLPRHMVPAAFVFLARLPLTASDKVDRRALPAPEWSGTEAVAPRTATEEAVAEIWDEVLGLAEGAGVGVHDDFFDRGGHSLLATRVVTRVDEAFAVRLPLRALFEHRTVAELAGVIEAAVRAEVDAMAEEEVAEELR